METLPQRAGAVCAICGAPLDGASDCPACLLLVGLDETVAEGPSPPTVFGDYEIARREDGALWVLGQGAMGVTYRATDRALHRSVALKVIEIPAEPERSQAVRERFLREARAAAALRHANVAGIFHLGALPDAGRCYYTMELVEGETLEARVRRDGPLEAETALEIALQVAAALAAAAQRGLIHRDLKPSNLMLTESDGPAGKRPEVKVIDFGLAKAAAGAVGEKDLTQGGFVGTPTFASPEQFCAHGAVDARSDFYSLGVTLWYALTGRVPFVGNTLDELRRQKTYAPMPSEQLAARKVPAPVIEFLRRALAAAPEARPASARELMLELEACRRQLNAESDGAKATIPPKRRGPTFEMLFVMGAILVLTVLMGAGAAWWSFTASSRNIADKSIAVLPFGSTSGDNHPDPFFAGGVRDEILNDLAKVADLKIISQVSVDAYANAVEHDRRDIAKHLGVAYLVEGSVHQEGKQTRVTARLIDARTSEVLWADRYDVRDLSDKFVVQSEIAQTIAGTLQAKLSPGEKAAIAAPTTNDPVAYAFYLQGRKSFRDAEWVHDEMALRQALRQFEEATEHDPRFFQAWCELVRVNLSLYWYNFDHTPERLTRTERAARIARQLRPDAGETHLMEGYLLYMAHHDFAAAFGELQQAARLLPNSAETATWLGYVLRRQGRWEDSVREFGRATALDPRNANLRLVQAETFGWMRRYLDAERALDEALAIDSRNLWYFYQKAECIRQEKADREPLRRWLQSVPADSESWSDVAARVASTLAIYDSDYLAAARALKRYQSQTIPYAGFNWPTKELEGRIASLGGDPAAAREAFLAARQMAAESAAERPQDAKALMVLARIDAELGSNAEAIREGQQACAMLPVSADAIDGSFMIQEMAGVCALTGERERAMDLLSSVVGKPVGPTYGDLLFHTLWQPLQEEPRFKTLVASVTPKSAAP